MKLKFTISCLLFVSLINAQTKFKVDKKQTKTWNSIYLLINKNGKTFKVLDSSKYIHFYIDSKYVFFAICSKKGSPGWSAIDANENILFQVYNTSFGEPSPDYLIENKIRIVDANNKIGFANEKGKIIIQPQFEFVTSFHKGKAIIGANCEKIPWDKHAKENDCHHYSIVCKKYGYINARGEILKIGNYKFEDIQKEINWKPDKDF